MHLSLIIPTFNEAERIGYTLRNALAYLSRQSYTWEILVVDDGSGDGTADIVRDRFPEVRRVCYRPNRGKGHAVRTGMLEGRGAYRVFSDADGSTPIEEIEKFWPRFEAGADVVIGSRALPDSDVRVHQAWPRENMGRLFNVWLRMLRLTPHSDTQCGFKGFTRKACETIFPRQRVERFGFDAELLYIAKKHGLRVEEVPVTWINSPRTTVNPVTDGSRMILDAALVRWRDLKGRYR